MINTLTFQEKSELLTKTIENSTAHELFELFIQKVVEHDGESELDPDMYCTNQGMLYYIRCQRLGFVFDDGKLKQIVHYEGDRLK